MKTLTEDEIAALLSRQPGWKFAQGKLTCECVFADFAEAMRFVNVVASAAEAAGHHPDIDIRYNRVRLSLITHHTGTVTGLDASLAEQIAAILPSDGPRGS